MVLLMSFDQMPVFSVLRGTMGLLTQRQKLLAENIANADTPGFTPRDVDEKGFQKALHSAMRKGRKTAITMQASEAGHFTSSRAGQTGETPVKLLKRPGSETTMNGNSVVLEEEVAKLAQTRMRYETAIGLYQKSLSLLRLGLKSPGS
ncbi:hypothetical protein MNBD_ALPHA06-1457 [hydrothermal vent metagenome]|uniref:Flagellar basal body rod protein N-terminal domain-containing protein n=1 Tax=hydrothermal vent metagenome TaxID=652676 RepID=A0A3B0S3N3_9ZZZZ